MKVGQKNKDGEKLVGYDVYHAPDGSAPGYYGRATSLRQARHMARTRRALPESDWGTAYAGGGCGVYGDAPRTAADERVEEWPVAWFGRGGWDSATRVWKTK